MQQKLDGTETEQDASCVDRPLLSPTSQEWSARSVLRNCAWSMKTMGNDAERENVWLPSKLVYTCVKAHLIRTRAELSISFIYTSLARCPHSLMYRCLCRVDIFMHFKNVIYWILSLFPFCAIGMSPAACPSCYENW